MNETIIGIAIMVLIAIALFGSLLLIAKYDKKITSAYKSFALNQYKKHSYEIDNFRIAVIPICIGWVVFVSITYIFKYLFYNGNVDLWKGGVWVSGVCAILMIIDSYNKHSKGNLSFYCLLISFGYALQGFIAYLFVLLLFILNIIFYFLIAFSTGNGEFPLPVVLEPVVAWIVFAVIMGVIWLMASLEDSNTN